MIKMTNIHKAFGDNKVLQGVDFVLNDQTVPRNLVILSQMTILI